MQISSVIEIPHRLIGALSQTHRKIAVSVAFRVLVLWAGILCGSTAVAAGQSPGQQTAIEASGEINLREEGITVLPESRVSVQRTADMLLVHVSEGEVLFKWREPTRYPVVVTAGNAQLSKIRASVCVQVRKERTIVNVLEGAVELSGLRTQEDRHDSRGIPLRTGDRAELRKIGKEMQFSFRPAGLERTPFAGGGPCSTIIRFSPPYLSSALARARRESCCPHDVSRG